MKMGICTTNRSVRVIGTVANDEAIDGNMIMGRRKKQSSLRGSVYNTRSVINIKLMIKSQ